MTEFVGKPTPSTEDLAYLAGLVDGEGWVGWHQTQVKLADGTKKPYRYPTVEVQMTTNGGIELGHRLFGGSVTYRDHANRNRKPTYKWVMANRNAEKLLRAIRPYLREKVAQADEILEHYGSRTATAA